MKHFRIKNWGDFQHYKDRCPPWIKLHREILSSRTWVALDSKGRELIMAVMLIAAGNDNKIPFDPEYIQRVAYMKHIPDLKPLLDLQFIEIIEDGANDTECTQMLASASSSVSVSSSVSLKRGAGEKLSLPDWISPETWEAYLDMRRRKNKPATAHAQKLILNKLEGFKNAGHSPNQCLEESIRGSWTDVYAPKADKPGRSTGYDPVRAYDLAMADATRAPKPWRPGGNPETPAIASNEGGRRALDSPPVAELSGAAD